LAARIAGEPPAFRAKPRFCEKDTVKRRKDKKDDERKQETNSKPGRSGIALRLKPPDVLSTRFHYNAFVA
jgi:succinylglutamate desuccinylase